MSRYIGGHRIYIILKLQNTFNFYGSLHSQLQTWDLSRTNDSLRRVFDVYYAVHHGLIH